MSRRMINLALVAGLLVGLSGCEYWRKHRVREGSRFLEGSSSDPAASDPTFARPDELKGFFPGRMQGTWSPEARNIERSLGVSQ